MVDSGGPLTDVLLTWDAVSTQLKRAVARGAYKKRGKKYKPLPGDGDA
jgi:hypothetical protein